MLHAGHDRRQPKLEAVEANTFVYPVPGPDLVWFRRVRPTGVLVHLHRAGLVDLGDSDRDWEMVGEPVLMTGLPIPPNGIGFRVDTWIDHGRQCEDLHRGRVNLDRGAGGNVLS